MRIVGVDIGMDNVGLFSLDLYKDVVKFVDGRTVLSDPTVFVYPTGSTGDLKIQYMITSVVNYVSAFNIQMVVIEQPFFAQTHAHAVLRLYRLFWGIIDALKEIHPTVEVRAITAPKARSLVGYKRALGKSVKEAVLIALQKLEILNHMDIAKYSEHAIDALVVVLAQCVSITRLSLITGEIKCLKE
jgi:Holliday junction resolvasome RuvABC endonuclease subunit